jgi:DNA-binding GntR family transcriptional regulator
VVSKASEQAYLELRSKILSGDLPPGLQLKEEEVAEMCGVSRTPVRDAMRRLESELFIRRTDSQRSYVAEWELSDIEEVFTLRTMLESHAVQRAAMRADAAQIQKFKQINQRVEEAIKGREVDVQGFLDANAQFHSLILDIAASERLAALLSRLILQPVVQQTVLNYDRAHLLHSHSEHVEITSALEHRDPDWAGAIMTAHIRRAFHVHADRLQKGRAQAAE